MPKTVDDMADESRWSERESDHDKLIDLSSRLRQLEKIVEAQGVRVDTLWTDRAKLIMLCVIIGAVTEALIKLFWPGAK